MSPTYNPSLRGGEGNSSCGLTVCLIITIVVVAILLTLMLIPVPNVSTGSTSGFSRLAKSLKKKQPRVHNPVGRPVQRVRANLGGAPPRPVQHHAPTPSPPAPLPAAQLMAPTVLPNIDPSLDMIQTSNSVGESEMNESSSASGGVVASQYSDSSYTMDPGVMTASSATDIQGVETFMPMMTDGVGSEKGPVDPSTGLPLFTTGKLVRSQMLGGHGAGSFLRKQQDPLSGYKRLGKNMCGAQNARRDMATRRVQFNAARLASSDGDPVLFNTSEFMYS